MIESDGVKGRKANMNNTPQVHVMWKTSVQPGPDGTPWVGIEVNTPLSAFLVGIDIASAEKLKTDLPELIESAIVEAKRQRTGLVVATPNTSELLKGVRNHGQGRRQGGRH